MRQRFLFLCLLPLLASAGACEETSRIVTHSFVDADVRQVLEVLASDTDRGPRGDLLEIRRFVAPWLIVRPEP